MGGMLIKIDMTTFNDIYVMLHQMYQVVKMYIFNSLYRKYFFMTLNSVTNIFFGLFFWVHRGFVE